MLLLAVDTSGKYGSIALARCGPEETCDVLDVVPLAGGTFSAQLVPQIVALLSDHGFGKQDMGAFAVASGPGSFTGLRVGLAAIKALSEVLQKPIATVSLLEAIAVAADGKGRVMAALDAGRNEIYAGEYEIGPGLAVLSERLLTREEFLAAIPIIPVITPDLAVAQIVRDASLQVQEIERPRADAVARQAWKKILAHQTVPPENLDANYIRRSDAEIFAKPTRKTLLIRRAAITDIPALMALDREAPTASHWSEHQYMTAVGSPGRAAFVVENNSTIQGFLVAGIPGREWEIENIVVATDRWRCGLGSLLLTALLGLARERSAEAVFLEVRETNRSAIAFYEKSGFTQTGRRSGYYQNPPEDALVYRLKIL